MVVDPHLGVGRLLGADDAGEDGRGERHRPEHLPGHGLRPAVKDGDPAPAHLGGSVGSEGRPFRIKIYLWI